MKHPGSTLFLRGIIILIGALMLAFCLFVLPAGIRAEDVGGYRPILLAIYAPAIPFFIVLYQTLKLLNFIDTGKAFSDLSVAALKNIKYCAASIGALFTAGMPYIYVVAERDDAPGVILMGLVIIFAATAVATFAAVLQKVLQDAIAIKSENDLTV